METTQIEIFNGLPLPKSHEQEVLLTLITQGSVSLKDFPIMAGFRTRVSNLQLKRNLFLECQQDLMRNKHGHVSVYHIHRLPETEKEKAIELYRKLIKAS